MMNYSWKHILTLLSAILLIAGGLINPATADSSCSVGAAVPPFLAAGVDPNLLLMIDNSASMYDLAYVKPREKGYCYDGTITEGGSPVESYDAAVGYFGYFDAASWYAYNFMTEKFEKTMACSTADYINSGSHIDTR
jgi:type IV pilus assembly protein PilY1